MSQGQSVANIFLGTEYEYEYIRNVLFNTNTNIFGITFWTEYEYEYICNHQMDRIRENEYEGVPVNSGAIKDRYDNYAAYF